MERDSTFLSLDNEEGEIICAPKAADPIGLVEEFCMVGCFLTGSAIDYLSMKSTMANVWHPIKGVQILDLGEKRFLFKFFHRWDMDRVLKGSPWTFNNHLLLLHHLKKGEDPLKVPLIFTIFWVQTMRFH